MKKKQITEQAKATQFIDKTLAKIRMQSHTSLSSYSEEPSLTDYAGQVLINTDGEDTVIAEFALTHVDFWNSPFDKLQTLDLRQELTELMPLIGRDNEYCDEIAEYPDAGLGFGIVFVKGIVVRPDMRGNGIAAGVFEYITDYFRSKAELTVGQAYPLTQLFHGAVMPADYYGLKEPRRERDEHEALSPASEVELKRLMNYYTMRVGFIRFRGSDNHLFFHPNACVLESDEDQ